MLFRAIGNPNDLGNRCLLGEVEAACEQTAIDIARSRWLKPPIHSISVEPIPCQGTARPAENTSPTPTDQPTAMTADGSSPAVSPEDQELRERVKAETEAMDVGQWPQTDEQRLIARYSRRRLLLTAEAERIREQLDAMIRGIEREISTLDYLYEWQARQIVARMLTGKARSIKTPWGTLGFRKYDGFIAIRDEKELTEAALASEHMAGVLKTEWRVSKSGLNQYFKETGDVPPGCEAVPSGDKFYVK